MENLGSECLNNFGKSIEKKLIAHNKYGGPIYGLTIDDKLISDIGLSVRFENSNQVINLIRIH